MRARAIYTAGHTIGLEIETVGTLHDTLGGTAAVTHLITPAEGRHGLDCWTPFDADVNGAKLNSTATAIAELLKPGQLAAPLYGAVIFTGPVIDGEIQSLTDTQDSILAEWAIHAQAVAA